jgi:hypothetical protein
MDVNSRRSSTSPPASSSHSYLFREPAGISMKAVSLMARVSQRVSRKSSTRFVSSAAASASYYGRVESAK